MLNENIKAIRKSKGLSQQDLADKLNVVRQTISKWGAGIVRPRFRSAHRSVGGSGDPRKHPAGRDSVAIGGR